MTRISAFFIFLLYINSGLCGPGLSGILGQIATITDDVFDATETIIKDLRDSTLQIGSTVSYSLANVTNDVLTLLPMPLLDIGDAVISLWPGILGGNIIESTVDKANICYVGSPLVATAIKETFACVGSYDVNTPLSDLQDSVDALRDLVVGIPDGLKDIGNQDSISSFFTETLSVVGGEIVSVFTILWNAGKSGTSVANMIPGTLFCVTINAGLGDTWTFIGDLFSFTTCMLF